MFTESGVPRNSRLERSSDVIKYNHLLCANHPLHLTKCWDTCSAVDHVHARSLSRVLLFVTPWTVAHQVPLFMGFSRPEYWSGWPFPSPGDPPNPGSEPMSPVCLALAFGSFTTEPGKPAVQCCYVQSPSHVQLFTTLWTAAHQASPSVTISWSLPKFISIESGMPSTFSSSVTLFFFCLQSFPASGSLQ